MFPACRLQNFASVHFCDLLAPAPNQMKSKERRSPGRSSRYDDYDRDSRRRRSRSRSYERYRSRSPSYERHRRRSGSPREWVFILSGCFHIDLDLSLTFRCGDLKKKKNRSRGRMYTRRSRSHEDNRYFVASFFPLQPLIWRAKTMGMLHSVFRFCPDTGRGLAESPEDDLDRAPSPPRLQKTLPPLPITPRKKCDRRVPPRGPGPGLRRDPAPVHALAPDLGPDASQGAARSSPSPLFFFFASFVKKICLFWHECNVPELFVGSSIIRGHFGKIPSLEYATVSVFNNKWPRVIVHYFWPDSFVLFFLIFVLQSILQNAKAFSIFIILSDEPDWRFCIVYHIILSTAERFFFFSCATPVLTYYFSKLFKCLKTGFKKCLLVTLSSVGVSQFASMSSVCV